MMSFVLVTKADNVIVIDGGRPEDMPLLKKYIDGRHISAWILTHPHEDHIGGFVDEIKKILVQILILKGYTIISLPMKS